MRNLDKLLWHGQKWAVEDIEEYAQSIKNNLDTLVQQFKVEMGVTPAPPKPTFVGCGCNSLRPEPNPDLDKLLKQLEPKKNEVGDKPEVPPTNILGDKDWPCDDPQCGCHNE